MGHNRKTASRAEAIRRNSERFRKLDKRTAALERKVRENSQNEQSQRLELERRILGDIELVLGTVVDLSDAFEEHRLPKWRKSIRWIRNVIQKARSSAEPEDVPEVIDLDFSEEDSGQEADGRAEGEPEADALSEPHYLGAIEADADPDNLDPDLGPPAPITVTDKRTGHSIEVEEGEPFLVPTGEAPNIDEARPVRMDVDLAQEIEEAGAMIKKPDPEKVLERLELRFGTANAAIADVFENQELDEEEKTARLDELAERIEYLGERIAAQRRTLGLPQLAPIVGDSDGDMLAQAIQRAKENRRKHRTSTPTGGTEEEAGAE
jgi:tetrahydromethanopterin S-methyltransferase subunit G